MEVGEDKDICIEKTSFFVPYRPPAFLHSSFCPCAGVARRDASSYGFINLFPAGEFIKEGGKEVWRWGKREIFA